MRPRGRPPLDVEDPSVDIHLRLPSKQYDQIYRSAQDARVTVPEWIRRRVADVPIPPLRDRK
jgi:hypothetical protein